MKFNKIEDEGLTNEVLATGRLVEELRFDDKPFIKKYEYNNTIYIYTNDNGDNTMYISATLFKDLPVNSTFQMKTKGSHIYVKTEPRHIKGAVSNYNDWNAIELDTRCDCYIPTNAEVVSVIVTEVEEV